MCFMNWISPPDCHSLISWHLAHLYLLGRIQLNFYLFLNLLLLFYPNWCNPSPHLSYCPSPGLEIIHSSILLVVGENVMSVLPRASGHATSDYSWDNLRSKTAQEDRSWKGHDLMPNHFPKGGSHVTWRKSSPFGTREAHGGKIRVWLGNGFPDSNLGDFLWPLLGLSLFLRVKKKDMSSFKIFLKI